MTEATGTDQNKLANFLRKHVDIVFAVLRNTVPNLSFGEIAVVTRYSDVKEVLET